MYCISASDFVSSVSCWQVNTSSGVALNESIVSSTVWIANYVLTSNSTAAVTSAMEATPAFGDALSKLVFAAALSLPPNTTSHHSTFAWDLIVARHCILVSHSRFFDCVCHQYSRLCGQWSQCLVERRFGRRCCANSIKHHSKCSFGTRGVHHAL